MSAGPRQALALERRGWRAAAARAVAIALVLALLAGAAAGQKPAPAKGAGAEPAACTGTKAPAAVRRVRWGFKRRGRLQGAASWAGPRAAALFTEAHAPAAAARLPAVSGVRPGLQPRRWL